MAASAAILRKPGGLRGAGPGVMHVALSLTPGGTERLIIEIARRLRSRFRMLVCCLDQPGEWAGELTASGIEVVTLGRQPGFHPQLARRVAEVAMAHGADVLHCHQYSPFVYGQLGAWLSRRLRVIYTEHGRLSDAPPSLKRRMANPILQLRQVQVCAVSEELRSHMHQWGFKRDRVRVVYNGVDPGPDMKPHDRVRARALLDLPPGIPVIGTVARLDPVKQLGTLIDAFALLVHRLPEARLVIVGDGPERAALEDRIRAHGLGSAVLLPGHRDDVRRLLPGFDLFVNCSITEGVSLTLLEAMAARVPVVATRVGGTPEVVMEGGTGCLVPPRSPEQLAYAIASLFADEPRRELMGRAARRRMVERFTLDGMVEAYAGLYTGGEN